MTKLLAIAIAMMLVSLALAEDPPQEPTIETRTVEYEKDGVTFHGYLAKPRDIDAKAPGVLVIHEWWGLNDFAKEQARRLAEFGYVAFAADMYGDGRTTTDPQQAGQWAGQVMRDRAVLRGRTQLALDVLAKMDDVDADRLAAIGYCFGGTTVVELAYSGAKLKAVVSFHGNPIPMREKDEDIHARILVLHGTADTLVPEERLTAFRQPLDEKGVQYRIIRYDGAKHAFTNPGADALGMEGVGYDAYAARRSWAHMRELFDEVFNEKR